MCRIALFLRVACNLGEADVLLPASSKYFQKWVVNHMSPWLLQMSFNRDWMPTETYEKAPLKTTSTVWRWCQTDGRGGWVETTGPSIQSLRVHTNYYCSGPKTDIPLSYLKVPISVGSIQWYSPVYYRDIRQELVAVTKATYESGQWWCCKHECDQV